MKQPRRYLRPTFIDSLRLHVKGGTGGAGLSRYGGLGGAGGSVYVVAKNGQRLENIVKSLKIKRIKADPGSDSTARGIIGAPGEDKIISVPLGITVYNQNGVLLGEHNFFLILCFKLYLHHYFLFFFIQKLYRRIK